MQATLTKVRELPAFTIDTKVVIKPPSRESLLKLAGADSWTVEQADAHKAAELAKAPPASPLLKYRWFFRELPEFFWRATAFAWSNWHLVITAACSLWLFGFAFSTIVCAFLGAMLGPFALAFLATVATNVDVRGPAAWRRDFAVGQKMPPRALALIEDIRGLLPNTQFYLDRLVQNDEVLDPVLYADHTPILVWDKDGHIVPPPA